MMFRSRESVAAVVLPRQASVAAADFAVCREPNDSVDLTPAQCAVDLVWAEEGWGRRERDAAVKLWKWGSRCLQLLPHSIQSSR